eukprot:2806588-Rhodomonas_salina.1
MIDSEPGLNSQWCSAGEPEAASASSFRSSALHWYALRLANVKEKHWQACTDFSIGSGCAGQSEALLHSFAFLLLFVRPITYPFWPHTIVSRYLSRDL